MIAAAAAVLWLAGHVLVVLELVVQDQKGWSSRMATAAFVVLLALVFALALASGSYRRLFPCRRPGPHRRLYPHRLRVVGAVVAAAAAAAAPAPQSRT